MQNYNKFHNDGSHGSPSEVVTMPSQNSVNTYSYPQEPAPQSMAILEVEQPWGWGTVVMSVISFFCCQIFGLIAIVNSLLAYTDHRAKDYAAAKNRKNCALGFGVTAIVIGCLCILTVIIVIATSGAMIASVVNSAHEEQSNSMDLLNKVIDSNTPPSVDNFNGWGN